MLSLSISHLVPSSCAGQPEDDSTEMSCASVQPDADLVHQIADGDEQALTDLYDRHGALIFSVALHIVRDRQQAEEVTLDVFHVVWNQALRYVASSGSVTGWMIAITRHRAIDVLRARGMKLQAQSVSLEFLPHLPVRDLYGMEHHIELRSDVQALLETLSFPQRQAIDLTYFVGLTTPEIAAHLGIPVSTVKTRLRLALCALRRLVERANDEGSTGELSGAQPRMLDILPLTL